jgi:trans-aconitate methyltransferase
VKEHANQSIRQDSTEWDPNLYQSKYAFVWKYGSDVVLLLAPQRGERILDLGCGTGHLTAQIADSGAEVVGVDRSPEMIAAARKTFSNLKLWMPGSFRLTRNLTRSFQTPRCIGFTNPRW